MNFPRADGLAFASLARERNRPRPGATNTPLTNRTALILGTKREAAAPNPEQIVPLERQLIHREEAFYVLDYVSTLFVLA